MTYDDAIERMKNYLHLPLKLYERDPDTFYRAIDNALDIINRLTGGRMVEGGPETEGDADWIAYGRSVLFFPDGVLDTPGAISYVAKRWDLDSIEKNVWLLPRFIKLAAYLADIDVAGKLQVADGMQESPIQFNFTQIAEDAQQRLRDLEEEIQSNWVTPIM